MPETTRWDSHGLAARLTALLRRRRQHLDGAPGAAGQIRAIRRQTVLDLAAVIAAIAAVSLVNLTFGGNGWIASVLGSTDGWTLGGVLPGFIALVIGLAWFAWRRMAYTSAQLRLREKAEEEERVIAAIGLGAGWDLDLGHVYARFANDLRSLVDYDRLTITMSRPDGRTTVEFIHGVGGGGVRAGSVIPPDSAEPDGLQHPDTRGFRSRLIAPFRGPGRLSGHMILRSGSPEAYGERESGLLTRVVAHVSLAVTNAHLFKATLRQVSERTALAEIGRTSTAGLDMESIFDEMRRPLSDLIGFDRMECALIDAQTGRTRLAYAGGVDVPGPFTGLRVGREPGERVEPSEEYIEALAVAGLKSWVETPLIARERVIGLIAVRSQSESAYDEDDRLLMKQVASLVAPAVENARLYAEAQREAKERTALAAVGLAVSSDLEIQRIFTGVADELAGLFSYDRLIVLLTNQGGELTVSFVQGVPLEGMSVGDIIPWEREAVAGAHTSGMQGMNSAIQAPLGGLGAEFGYVEVGSLDHDAYTVRDKAFLGLLAAHIAPAIVNANLLTHERELRERIADQNEELQAANEAKNRFLSQVSHELKTPLTVVSGFLDLLVADQEGNLTLDQRESLEIMQGNAHRLDVLINDLLDLSRIDIGRFNLEKGGFDAVELLRETVRGFQPILACRRQTLSSSLPEGELWMHADRERLGQVTSNLLSNASKYSPEDSQIELSADAGNGALHVAVSDRGIGISEEDQRRIFAHFYRVESEETRGVPGTGLGLAIAKSLVDLHGGTMWVSSELGEGTTVEYEVPGVISGATKAHIEMKAAVESAAPRSPLTADHDPGDMELSAG